MERLLRFSKREEAARSSPRRRPRDGECDLSRFDSGISRPKESVRRGLSRDTAGSSRALLAPTGLLLRLGGVSLSDERSRIARRLRGGDASSSSLFCSLLDFRSTVRLTGDALLSLPFFVAAGLRRTGDELALFFRACCDLRLGGEASSSDLLSSSPPRRLFGRAADGRPRRGGETSSSSLSLPAFRFEGAARCRGGEASSFRSRPPLPAIPTTAVFRGGDEPSLLYLRRGFLLLLRPLSAPAVARGGDDLPRGDLTLRGGDRSSWSAAARFFSCSSSRYSSAFTYTGRSLGSTTSPSATTTGRSSVQVQHERRDR